MPDTQLCLVKMLQKCRSSPALVQRLNATRKGFYRSSKFATPVSILPSAIAVPFGREHLAKGTQASIRASRHLSSSASLAATPTAAMEAHAAAIQTISATVARYHAQGTKYRIFHGSTNSTRPRPSGPIVDTGPLCRVLHVDRAARRALVEPNVPMDRLVEAALAHGLVPLVITEFPGITAAGAYAGTAGESSSFREGFFSDNLERVEMVLADGSVVKCSRDERPDLFTGAAGAVGTLGVTTLLELRLREAKQYVATTYHPVRGIEEATEKIKEMVGREELDYVDGIMFSADTGAVVTG